MRSAFTKTLAEEAKKNKAIFLLYGDLGYGAIELFRETFPGRSLNLGVAEQNLVGFASGMAISGKIPIVYSIATFLTLRCYEQIRNDVCYQNLNVKFVGVGEGLTYSQYGATHHSMEDIGLMRLLPNMTVLCPGDPLEVGGAVKAMLAYNGPCYLRIGNRGEPILNKKDLKFKIGKGIVLRDGREVALVVTGNMLENAVKAADILKNRGIIARVISMPTVKPLDEQLLFKTASNFGYIFTVEEHSKIGGLGSAVAELLSENRIKNPVRFHRIAGPDAFQKVGGWLPYLRERNGLSPEKIAAKVSEIYNSK